MNDILLACIPVRKTIEGKGYGLDLLRGVSCNHVSNASPAFAYWE